MERSLLELVQCFYLWILVIIQGAAEICWGICYKLRAGIRELEAILLQRLVPVDDRYGQFIETRSFLHARQWDIFHTTKLDKI